MSCWVNDPQLMCGTTLCSAFNVQQSYEGVGIVVGEGVGIDVGEGVGIVVGEGVGTVVGEGVGPNVYSLVTRFTSE